MLRQMNRNIIPFVDPKSTSLAEAEGDQIGVTAAGTIPGIGIGSNHDTEHLLAGPQLHRLEYGGSGQVNMLIGVTHVRT